MSSRENRSDRLRNGHHYKPNLNNRGGKKINKFRGSSQYHKHRSFNDRGNWKQTHYRRSSINYSRQDNYGEKDSYKGRSYGYDQEVSDLYMSFDDTGANRKPEETGPPPPGSEADRINKIELEKKRIKEALSSGTDINKTITYNNDVIESRAEDRITVSKKFNTELGLTTNDLIEIGSVTGTVAETNEFASECTETVSENQNVSKTNTERSNKPSSNNSKATGWKFFQIPNDTAELNSTSQIQNMTSKLSNQNYKQAEERILGNIEDSRQKNVVVTKSLHMNDTDRIGRLYKSFLKTRYIDKKNKANDGEPQRLKFQNPFLDTSVARSENTTPFTDKEKRQEEPPMPTPIQVKLEANERREELEADEFLKDFSHLLTSDYKIPPEILEQLGLHHLLEDSAETTNDTNNPFRENQTSQNKPDSLLRVKSLTALNSTPFIDSITPQRNDTISPASVHSTMRHNSPNALLFNQSFNASSENNSLNTSVDTLVQLGFNVEHVMNEVVEKIVTKAKSGPAMDLNQSNESYTYRHNDMGSRPTVCCNAQNQLANISDKVLKMFIIDKKIQELMEEKKVLYNELMAAREVASTFFNSWANENQTRMPSGYSPYQQFSNDQHLERTNLRVNENNERGVATEQSIGRNDMSTLLNNVEEVKQYLMNFQSNTITEAVSACKQSLIQIKKETITNDGKAESTGEINNSQLTNSTFQKGKKSKKRKKNNNNNMNGKKVCVDNIKAQDMQQPEDDQGSDPENDDIIIINSDEENEKFEDLYETKFEPSKLKLNIKAPSEVQLNNKTSKRKGDTNLVFNHPDITIVCMKVAETHKACVTGCRDGQVLLYSLVTGKLKGRLKGHEESITCLVEYKGLIISGSTDSTLRCFHIKTKTQLFSVNVGYAVQCMDLRYGYLFVGTKVGYLFTYTVKEDFTLIDDPLSLTDSSILALRAAKEGVRNVLIVAARGQQITVRDATTGLLLRTFSWCDTVYCLEFAGESPIVYCGTRSKSVVAVDFINGEEKFKCDAGRGVSQIYFAHNLMFTACYDGKIYVYDYKKMTLVTHVLLSKGMILSLLVYNNKILVSTTRNEFLAIPFPEELKNYLQFGENK